MKVTVNDCLELSVFKEAKVLAGARNLTNEVRSVSVLDIGDAADFNLLKCYDTEVLLTGFLGVRNDVQRQCEIVRGAVDNCSALAVFFVGKIVKKLDERVIRAAEEVGLPLLLMPQDACYSDAISEIMDRVLYGDNFRNSLISNTVFHLLNFEKHTNFQAAVREAAISNDFQVVLLSEDFNPVLSVETRHKVKLSDAIRQGKEKKVEAEMGNTYTLIDVDGALTYWGLVNIGSEKYYMLIVDNEDSYTAGEITKLAEIIELAMGMWKYTPERDAKSEFIKALIRGNKSLAYTLQDEAKIQGSDIVCVFFSKGFDREIESQAFAEFEKRTDLEIMKITEEDETYGMILNTVDNSNRSAQQSECANLFSRLKADKGARIFHVTGLNGIEGAGDAYKLISESWTFVQSVFPYKRVFTKYELTLVNNCINIQIQGGFVKKNYVELLEPFKEAGENKSKQLLYTLETFVLDAGMNSSKTAEIMNVHANTVQYRLKKINEMLGVEVTGNRVIPGLTMALALKRLERSVT